MLIFMLLDSNNKNLPNKIKSHNQYFLNIINRSRTPPLYLHRLDAIKSQPDW